LHGENAAQGNCRQCIVSAIADWVVNKTHLNAKIRQFCHYLGTERPEMVEISGRLAHF
jgi:hypothetical protein